MRPAPPSRDESDAAARTGRRARLLLVWAVVALLATGVGWLVGHDLWLQQTPFGAQPHPVVPWLLRAHGVIAWAATLVGGVVWQVHVRPAWRHARRRWGRDALRGAAARGRLRFGRARTISGAVMALVLALLLATAAALQYAPEWAHDALSVSHWVLGLVVGVAVLWHWLVRLRR